MIIFVILGILIGAVSIIFALQNVEPVTVLFFSYQLSGSLSLVLFLTLVGGMLVSALVLLPSFIRAEFRISTLKKQYKALQDEMAATRERIHESASGPQIVESNMVSLE